LNGRFDPYLVKRNEERSMTPLTNIATFEELDYRECDGIEVSLLWNRRDGSLSVFVFDSRASEAFELGVTPEAARDVFQHPFAHAAFRGVDAQPIERTRSATCA
jgi:hypothetical protein